MQHYTILLNRTGDVALSWDTEDDVEVLTYIQKKMNEGYVFFILEKGFFKIRKRMENVCSNLFEHPDE